MLRLFSVVALLILTAVPGAAQSRPGDRQFMMVEGHNPAALQSALRTGADLIKSGQVRQFRIYLIGRAVILGIRGVPSVVQNEMEKTLRQNRGLHLVACKETVQVIARKAGRQPPFLPGTVVETCRDRRQQLQRDGWQRAIGF